MSTESIKTKRKIGIAMFVLGTIVAIASAAKMPVDGATYPSTLVAFVLAFVIAIFGNVLWHKTQRATIMAELEEHKNDEASNPIMLLEKTIPAIEELKNNFESYKGMDLCYKIDEIHDSLITPFTDKRKTFMDMLGQAHGAEVLLMIAYAERMLNRTWSAQSDGHPPEAKASLEDSLANYKNALAKTKEYNS